MFIHRLTICLFLIPVLTSRAEAASDRPNIILIFCDNLGYGDIGCYGSTLHRTPQIDRLAEEGLKLTDFYVSSGVCTPSRASLMTGCYPRRVNMHVSDTGGSVLQPVSPKGLNPDEVTIAEILKDRGYQTAIAGKWHLGDQPAFLPSQQGFDEFLGLPYSDDMTPRKGKNWPPLPLMQGDDVIDSGVDRNELTKLCTEFAVDFIMTHQAEPFFLYFPQPMPGSTANPFASDKFRGKSQNGSYGDAVEEMDWSTGEILSAVQRAGIDDQTLIIWTSDNGAPRYQVQRGSNAPLKGWGYNVSEGAMRVPCLARWPGKIPAGVVSSIPCMTIDLLPTLAQLAGADLPTDRIIDGRDIWPILAAKPEAADPHEALYFYQRGDLQAIRSGPWKLYLATKRSPAERLYRLDTDISEEQNVIEEFPDVVTRLKKFASHAREDLGDGDQTGAHQRPAGWVENPTPLLPQQ